MIPQNKEKRELALLLDNENDMESREDAWSSASKRLGISGRLELLERLEELSIDPQELIDCVRGSLLELGSSYANEADSSSSILFSSQLLHGLCYLSTYEESLCSFPITLNYDQTLHECFAGYIPKIYNRLQSFLTTWLAEHDTEAEVRLLTLHGNLPTREELLTASRAPIETARDAVRRDLTGLQKAFPDLGARLVAGIALKKSLRTLEQEAAHYDYETLSRVAAVLHDTLKNNPIEGFEEAELQGFLEASQQATEGRPDNADPYKCELALFRADLSWLPAVSYVETAEEDEEDAKD